MQGATWSIGDTTVTRIESANFVLPSTTAMPTWSVPAFAPSVEHTSIAFSALVVRTPTSTIVVDPWLVDDGPRHLPVDEADAIIAALLDEVADVGAAPEAVDTVVLSHVDGIGWSTRPTDHGWQPTFPNARYLLPTAELAAIDRGEEINGAEYLGPLRQAGQLHTVDPPCAIDPCVSLVDAPGHNFGHVAVRIEDGSSLAIYPGHLVLSLIQVDDPDADAGDVDLITAAATRRVVLDELASRDGVLLTTLVGGRGGGVVQRSGSGYRLVT